MLVKETLVSVFKIREKISMSFKEISDKLSIIFFNIRHDKIYHEIKHVGYAFLLQ